MNELKSIFSHIFAFFKKAAKSVNWQQAITIALPVMAGAADNILTLTGNGEDVVLVNFIVGKIQGGFAQISSLVENYQASTHTGFVAQVTAIVSGIQADSAQLLSESGVKDATTVANITKWVNLINADLQNLLMLIPKTAPAAVPPTTAATGQ